MSDVQLDCCQWGVHPPLLRIPIKEARGVQIRASVDKGEALHLDMDIHIITSTKSIQSTLREFCELCEPESFPFKVIVIRKYPWARVRDDREFKCDIGPCGLEMT